MAGWNVQYTKYNTIHNTMYHIIMSADIRNGRIFRSGCHIGTWIGLLEYTLESSRFILGYPYTSRHRIHTRFTLHSHKLPDKIRGNEDGILYWVTEEAITFLHTSVDPHTAFIKPLAIYSTMVCHNTVQSVAQDVM